jgi:hypothetical protein
MGRGFSVPSLQQPQAGRTATPDVLALLGDGVPRSRGTIVAALADRHAKQDIRRTLMRLAVTERLVETDGKDTLPAVEAARAGLRTTRSGSHRG